MVLNDGHPEERGSELRAPGPRVSPGGAATFRLVVWICTPAASPCIRKSII